MTRPHRLESAAGDASYFGGRVVPIALPAIEDASGSLLPIDTAALGFHPVRSFLVHGRPGAVRGGHGHRSGRQLLVRVSGEIAIDLSHDGTEHRIVLGRDADAVLIAAPVWARQTYLGEAPCLLVYSDQPYDPASYVLERT